MPLPNGLARLVFGVITFFGIVLVFLTPPMQPPDEDSHFVRSVMLADGHAAAFYNGEQWVQRVPDGLRQYVDSHRYLHGRDDRKYPFRRWWADTHQQSSKEPKSDLHYSALPLSPLLYLPQAAGILARSSIG